MSRRWPGVLANVIAASPMFTRSARARILRTLGVRIGAGTRVSPFVRFIGNADHLQIGRKCFINVELLIGSGAPILIGDGVLIGPRVQLLPTTHEIGRSDARGGARTYAGIEIGAGSWIGAGVIVLSGVTIGSGCVIAAGAVVTNDCDANSLYAGVPARLIRTVDPQLGTKGFPDGTSD